MNEGSLITALGLEYFPKKNNRRAAFIREIRVVLRCACFYLCNTDLQTAKAVECSGYLKETAVFSVALSFVYHWIARCAVYLKNSHRKKGRNS